MKYKDLPVNGQNIFVDNKGQKIYYNLFTKKGYIIPKKDEEKFKRYQSRIMLPIITFIFTYILFELKIYVAIGLTLASLAIIEYRFYKLINSYTIISNFNINKFQKQELSEEVKKEMFKKSIIYYVIALILIVNGFLLPLGIKSNDLNIYIGINVILAILVLYYAINLTLSLRKK